MVKGIVTFSFDDGSPGWILAADVLERFGYRGTFNVTIRNVVKRKMGNILFPEDRTIHENDLRELQDRGHEIGSHGLRHIHLKDCNETEIHHELKTSKEILESLGLRVSTFTCPFSSWSDRVKSEALRHYGSMRYGLGFNRMPFDGRLYKSVLGSDDMKAAIDRAVAKNLWSVLLFHNVKKGSTDQFSHDLTSFTSILNYAHSKGVQVRTVKDVIEAGT